MFIGNCHQDTLIMEDILVNLIEKEQIFALRKTCGINCREVNELLLKIKKYHEGIYQHSLNVARLSALLSRQLNLPKIEIYTISIGALLHDIGKIFVPPYILNKQGKLNKNEWTLIKKHPRLGAEIVSRYDWGQQLQPMILLHHERLDGNGYYNAFPEEIPISARIITLTDAFDAMTSPRPYQEQRNFRDSWAEIERCSGTQFDPDLLSGFKFVIA